jgi:hypothetical protein
MKRFRTKRSLEGFALAAATLMFLMLIRMIGLATDMARMSTAQ